MRSVRETSFGKYSQIYKKYIKMWHQIPIINSTPSHLIWLILVMNNSNLISFKLMDASNVLGAIRQNHKISNSTRASKRQKYSQINFNIFLRESMMWRNYR